MSVKVDVKMDEQSMTDFMVYHIYSSVVGVVCVVLGILNVGLTVAFIMRRQYLYMCMFLFFAVLILVIFPSFIRGQVRRQMKHSKRLDVPVSYEFMEDGILTATANDSGKATWDAFKKAVSRKRIIILYDAKKRTIILPVDQMGEKYTPVVDMIFAHMPAPAVRIRRLDRAKNKQAGGGEPQQEDEASKDGENQGKEQ